MLEEKKPGLQIETCGAHLVSQQKQNIANSLKGFFNLFLTFYMNCEFHFDFIYGVSKKKKGVNLTSTEQ